MKINKAFVFLVLVFVIIGVTSASEIFNDDTGSGVTLFVSIPQPMANFLENLPIVDSVEIQSDHTNIFMEIGENAQQIKETADLLEHKIIDNKANVIEIAGSPPLPICMRDTVTNELYGIYIENGQLNLVEGDSLCT